MVPRSRVVVALLLAAAAGTALAQQPRVPPVDGARVVELRLTDSTTLRGRIVAADTASLTLVTAAGVRVSVPIATLALWRDVAAPPPGLGRRDPNDARLFLTHTARAVPKGRFTAVDYLVFFPVASYGLTDRFSVTGGMSLIPFSPDQIFYVAPKVTAVEAPRFALAAGVLYLRVVGFVPTTGYAGVAYGVTTVGDSVRSATVLVGFPFASGGWERRPLVALGGESRISPRVKLLAEGWSIPGTDVVPAVGGFRLIGEHVSWDFGLMFLFGARGVGAGFLPWVDFSLHW